MTNIQYPDFSCCVGGLGLALALNSLAPPHLINGLHGVINRAGALSASGIVRMMADATHLSATSFFSVSDGCNNARNWLWAQSNIYIGRGQELRGSVAYLLSCSFHSVGMKASAVGLAALKLETKLGVIANGARNFALGGWDGLPQQVEGARAAQPNQ